MKGNKNMIKESLGGRGDKCFRFSSAEVEILNEALGCRIDHANSKGAEIWWLDKIENGEIYKKIAENLLEVLN